MSDEFSLRELVLAVVAADRSEDRDQILKEIEQRIPPEATGEALRQALPSFLHYVTPRWPRDSHSGGGAGSSRKVASIREAWKRHLEARYTVADGSLRMLGDFDEADLIFKAGYLEDQARQNRARAGEMKAFAVALKKYGVRTVRELPDEYLATFFRTAP